MKYIELIKIFKEKSYRKIIVTGPQRSGTGIAVKILAKELGLEFIGDKVCKIRFEALLEKLSKNEKFIAHAVGLTHYILDFPKDSIIVFMDRNIKDIIKSQKRIEWRWEDSEKRKFRKWSKILNLNQPISKLKYDFLKKIAIPQCKIPIYRLEYESLKIHPKWVDKKYRINFKKRQTSL